MKKLKMNTLEQFRKEQLKNPEFKQLVGLETQKVRLGYAIHRLRTAAGLTQAQLAHKVGVKQGYIARLEVGELGNLRISTLHKLAAALNHELVITIRSRRRHQTKKKFSIA